MNSFHKIFFTGVVILSVAAGSNFTDATRQNGGHEASIIVSISEAAPVAEKIPPVETVQQAIPNESTTANDIKVKTGDEPGVLPLPQNILKNEDSKSALDNVALLKPESTQSLNAFQKTGSAPPPEIQANSALVADLDTGQAYFELNPSLRWPTASLTKLMTAVMASRNIDLKRPLTLTGEFFPTSEETTTSAEFFKAGDVYSGSDVFSTMLLISKNEAAEALANVYGRNDFISGLNEIAREFGMSSTNFADPTGLSTANQSTAQDLRKLALNIYRDYREIFEITRKKSAAVTELDSRKRTALPNINIFAGTYGFVGGKTGYTGDAGGNLLSVFSYEGRPIAVIVLGTEDRFGETSNLFQWFTDNFKKS